MLTAAIYTTSLMLLGAGFWRVGPRPVLFILAGATVAGYIAGMQLEGDARVVANILIDLAIILAIKQWRDRLRDRSVALVSLSMILFACLYEANAYTDHWTYAAGVNCAAALQLLIGGGMADELARRIDHWLDSVWPWWASAVRYVVT